MANYPEFSAFYSLYLLGLQGRRVDVRLDVAVAQNREYGGIKKMDDRWIGLWFHKFQSTDGRDERIARNSGRAIERGRITVDMEDRSQNCYNHGLGSTREREMARSKGWCHSLICGRSRGWKGYVVSRQTFSLILFSLMIGSGLQSAIRQKRRWNFVALDYCCLLRWSERF